MTARAELPTATIRQAPEDFVVEEIPAYPPSGEGDHVLVTFRKVGLTTPAAVSRIARALGADPKAAGFAGMKDKFAVATQRASFFLPGGGGAADPEARLGAGAAGQLDGITVLDVSRHPHKLKAGHLKANRFHITLREVDQRASAAISAQLEQIRRLGVPNHYGAQRFGLAGANAERAQRWICQGGRPPRKRSDRRLLFSAWQSGLFNQVLDQRIAAGSWATVLGGDIAKKHDTGGLFEVGSDPAELDEAAARAAGGQLSATGPMFGAKMRWPGGSPGELERAVLSRAGIDEARLTELKKMGCGTRRSLRLIVSELSWRADPDGSYLETWFVLPKGGYATTVLGRACRLRDAQSPQS